jgi:hypothetical protein
VCSPPHEFRECPDGSLEIRNSISNLLRGDTDGHSDDELQRQAQGVGATIPRPGTKYPA